MVEDNSSTALPSATIVIWIVGTFADPPIKLMKVYYEQHFPRSNYGRTPRSFIREILKDALDPIVIPFAGGLPNRELLPA